MQCTNNGNDRIQFEVVDPVWVVRECKDDPHKAKCFMCWKIIDLGKMGESALKSHMT